MGIGVLLPTADDVNVVLSNGSELVRVDNDSVHLTPYLAALYYGNNGYFAHTFLQLDIDTNGNDVFVNADGTGLTRAGSWNDQTLLAVDVGLGRWMYRNAQSRALSGLAWHSELHYTNSVTDADYIRQGAFVIGDPNSDLDLLNATVGATAEFAQVTRLTAGYSLPLTSSDRVFDGEFRLFVNRYW